MSQTVFFSWQSDSSRKTGKDFLDGILSEICSDISSDTALDLPDRDSFVLDSDTKGIAGQPPIFDTIRTKIEKCAIFIADLTPVGERKHGKGLIANPNVLIEYGYAMKVLGHNRIIYVMNIAHGKPGEHGENLPFDLRHSRHPITYNLQDSATPDEIAAQKSRLCAILKPAIIASIKATPSTNILPTVFAPKKPLNGPARFRSVGEELGTRQGLARWGDGSEKIFLPDGAAMWLRVMPITPLPKPLTNVQAKKMVEGSPQLTTLIPRAGGYDFFRAEDGMGIFYSGTKNEEHNSIESQSICFLFTSGEIWSIETALLQYSEKVFPFLEPYFEDALRRYVDFLSVSDIKGPYKWFAGICGVRGRAMEMPPPPPGKIYVEQIGPSCLSETIQGEGVINFDENPKDALRPFFEEVFDKCTFERPSHLG